MVPHSAQMNVELSGCATSLNETGGVLGKFTAMPERRSYDTLVLSAGGTYAVAYIGAIRALEERFIVNRLKHLHGTSAGALICAMVAVGITSAEMLQIMEEWGATDSSPRPVDFMRIPSDWGALDAEKVVGQLVDKVLLPEETFATLAKRTGRHLTVYAYNIDTGDLDALGIDKTPDLSVRRAICASCSVPLLFMPVSIDDTLYVDGAVMQRTPVHNVINPESTIAIDVRERVESRPSDVLKYFTRITSGASRYLGGFKGQFVSIKIPTGTPTLLDSPYNISSFKAVEASGFEAIQRCLLLEDVSAFQQRPQPQT